VCLTAVSITQNVVDRFLRNSIDVYVWCGPFTNQLDLFIYLFYFIMKIVQVVHTEEIRRRRRKKQKTNKNKQTNEQT